MGPTASTAANTAWSITSRVPLLDASAAHRNTSSGSTPAAGGGRSSLQSVLGDRAGLVGAEHVDATELLDRGQVADHGVVASQLRRAHGHRHRQHRRQRHGDRRHRHHQRELQQLGQRVASRHPDDDDHGDQDNCEQDQVARDAQHRLLEVADRARFQHQLSGSTEVGAGSRRDHNGLGLTERDHRPRVALAARGPRHRQRFAGQRRLVDLQIGALQQHARQPGRDHRVVDALHRRRRARAHRWFATARRGGPAPRSPVVPSTRRSRCRPGTPPRTRPPR